MTAHAWQLFMSCHHVVCTDPRCSIAAFAEWCQGKQLNTHMLPHTVFQACSKLVRCSGPSATAAQLAAGWRHMPQQRRAATTILQAPAGREQHGAVTGLVGCVQHFLGRPCGWPFIPQLRMRHAVFRLP
jgi:hypothetical protein